jgi:hypothetical protein
MHSSVPSSSFSVSSVLQYTLFAVVLYVLAGAPLSSVFGGSYSGEQGSGAADTSVEKLENLVIPEKNLSCAEHAYKGVHVLSREPLVLYIDGFLGEGEARHVVGARFVESSPARDAATANVGMMLIKTVNHTSPHQQSGPQAKKPSTQKSAIQKKHLSYAIKQ